MIARFCCEEAFYWCICLTVLFLLKFDVVESFFNVLFPNMLRNSKRESVEERCSDKSIINVSSNYAFIIDFSACFDVLQWKMKNGKVKSKTHLIKFTKKKKCITLFKYSLNLKPKKQSTVPVSFEIKFQSKIFSALMLLLKACHN